MGEKKTFPACFRGRASFILYWEYLLKHGRKKKMEKAMVPLREVVDSIMLNIMKLFLWLGTRGQHQQLHMVRPSSLCLAFLQR